MITLQAAL